MLDNTYENRLETLDRYLMGELNEDERQEIEQRLQNEPELAEELELLRVSTDAVQSQALREQIGNWHSQFAPAKVVSIEKAVDKDTPTEEKVRSIWRQMGKYAAGFLIGVLGYIVVQYATVSPENLYDDNFVQYQLPVTRTVDGEGSIIDSLYVAKEYLAVTERFSELSSPNQQDLFLAAMSSLSQSNYQEAIEKLTQLSEYRRNTGEKVFVDETDFYLALAYLGAGNYESAKEIFREIKSNPQHTYHQNISNSDLRKLKMLAWLN